LVLDIGSLRVLLSHCDGLGSNRELVD
jgi:hypothetical protein